MLTGRVPFDGHDAMAIVTAHLSSPVPRPSQFRPQLPAWVDLVVGRALAKRPADRWQSMADFGAAIAAGDGRPTVATTATPSALLATYDIGERIGPGRLGSEVFRGVHRALGHPVAIRMLRPSGQRNWDGVRGRFLREARTLQLAHPSIIQVRDYGEEGGPRLRRHRIHPGAEPARADGGDGRDPVAASVSRCSSQLVDAAQALHRRNGLLCGLTPDIIRISRASGDEEERLMISTRGHLAGAGPARDAAGADAAGPWPRRRGAALRRARAVHRSGGRRRGPTSSRWACSATRWRPACCRSTASRCRRCSARC